MLGLKKALLNFIKAMQEQCNVYSLIIARTKDSLIISQDEWDLVTGIYDICLPIGYCLVLLFFCLDLSKVLRKGELTAEDFAMLLLKLWIGEAVMTYALAFVGSFVNIGNSFVTQLMKYVKDSPIKDAVANTIDNSSTLELIVILCMSLAPWMVAQIAYGIALFQILSRKIELLGRVAFAPIGMSDIFGEGKENAIRYAKKVLAVGLQGGGMIVALYIVGALAQNNVVQLIDYGDVANKSSLEQIVYAFLAIGAIGTSKTIISDTLGV